MADTKISDLLDGAPAVGTDITVAARGGASVRLTLANIKDYILGLANAWTANQTISSASLILSGNISAAAWGTAGIKFKETAATLTDTSSSGTVADARTHALGGNTIASASPVTFTDYYSMFLSEPAAGSNVSLTRKWALGLSGGMRISGIIAPSGFTNVNAEFTNGAFVVRRTDNGNNQFNVSVTGRRVSVAANGAFDFSNTSDNAAATPDAGFSRAAAGVVRLTDGSIGGGAAQFTERTAPTAPATNNCILFAEDNGAGKTRLVVRFPTGADVVLATEV